MMPGAAQEVHSGKISEHLSRISGTVYRSALHERKFQAEMEAPAMHACRW